MDLCPAHTRLGELENGSQGFILKTHQIFSVHAKLLESNGTKTTSFIHTIQIEEKKKKKQVKKTK